jgi:hypothetical protein
VRASPRFTDLFWQTEQPSSVDDHPHAESGGTATDLIAGLVSGAVALVAVLAIVLVL